MLGWSFTVTVSSVINQQEPIAYWEGGLCSDQWLKEAVANEEANLISNKGGYPNIYIVRTAILPDDKVLNKPDIDWCILEVWDQS